MIRLGIDGRELIPGVRTGIGRYVREILRAACAREWDCIVYSNGPVCRGDIPSRVMIKSLPQRWTAWWDQITLPRQLKKDRVSAWLSPYYKTPLMGPCPTVITIHDLFFIGYPGQSRPVYDALMTRLGRIYAGRAAAVIADSDYSKRSIIDRLALHPEKITVIPVALGNEFRREPLTERIQSTYGLSLPYVLSVGNFKPHKNIPRLLEAFAGLDRSLRSSHQLVLAGGDHRAIPALHEQARRLGIEDRVKFTGLIDDADLPALYANCALFMLPSLSEGFGLPALEAMACGAPVAASNRTAIPEVVGEAGVFFDPEHTVDITKAMTELLIDTPRREELRARGIERARAFSVDRTAGLVLELVADVIRRRDACHRRVSVGRSASRAA